MHSNQSGAWEQRHRIRGKSRIDGGNRQPVLNRLSDQQSIEWVVVDWQKMGKDMGVPSLFDHSLFGAEKKSPRQDGRPSW